MIHKTDIETARMLMIEYTLKKLIIVFDKELSATYAEYDRLAGWIKKGLRLGKLMEYARGN